MKIEKALLRFDEVTQILGCSKRHIYNLLEDGKLKAHNPSGVPGSRGTRILSDSVRQFLQDGEIPVEKWTE